MASNESQDSCSVADMAAESNVIKDVSEQLIFGRKRVHELQSQEMNLKRLVEGFLIDKTEL